MSSVTSESASSTSPAAEGGVEPHQGLVVRTPGRVAAEASQEVVLGVAGEGVAAGDGAPGAIELLPVVEPLGDRVHEVGVQPGVATGGRGEVPAVDQVVGGQLHGVLLLGSLTEGQLHGAALRQLLGHRGDRAPGSRQGGVDRVLAEHVPFEPVTDLLDGGALHEWDGPEVLGGHVVGQVADRPPGARGGITPLVRPHFVDAVGEVLDGPVVDRVRSHLVVLSRLHHARRIPVAQPRCSPRLRSLACA